MVEILSCYKMVGHMTSYERSSYRNNTLICFVNLFHGIITFQITGLS
jgi:hypothetical protein